MARSIKQMLPLLTILALAGYCCWSEEDSTPPKSSGKGAKNSSSPEITQALLTPSSAPVPVRNPFQNPSVDPSKTKKALATAAKKGDLLAAKSDLEKQLKQLVLRATFIQGERRLAMINDRFYGEGDLLPHPTPISPPLLGKGPSIEVAKTDLPSWRIVTVFPEQGPRGVPGPNHGIEISTSGEKDSVVVADPGRGQPKKASNGGGQAMSATLERTAGQPLLVEILLQKGILDAKKLETLHEAQSKENSPLERILIKKGLASDREIAQAYAEFLCLPLYEPDKQDTPLSPVLGQLLPEKLCRDQLIAPIANDGETLDVVFVTPNEMLVIDEIQLITGLEVRPHIAPFGIVEGLLEILYGSGQTGNAFVGGSEEFEEADEEDGEASEDQNNEILHLDQPPPPGRDGRIIRMVNQILEQALRSGASDIHLEPFEDGCKIRFRIDGMLHEISPPARALFLPVVSRFKILAKMDIAEKRVSQDGAIALRNGEKRVDLRVNTVPTVYGEKMVMRILDKGTIPLQLTGLGFDERQSKDLIESIRMPHGLMLVTGPTGSGKSTTLYACLNLLNEPDTNICTVEDPVEYKFKGMNQVQVKSQVGLTFASALRSFLRQDPDIIMVGEVRDPETAQICLRAALTGHFVLSTIHTNDSLSAVSRLQDMGIEPFLLASTLRVLEAQRLIRRLCKECKEPYACDGETARRHGLEQGQTLYHPKGCPSCRGTGYRGRVGIFEVIRITPRLANLIQERTALPEMRRAAREQGMTLLAESAIDKVRQGLSSLEESLNVAMAEEE